MAPGRWGIGLQQKAFHEATPDPADGAEGEVAQEGLRTQLQQLLGFSRSFMKFLVLQATWEWFSLA